jgi:hypothetical protein
MRAMQLLRSRLEAATVHHRIEALQFVEREA